MPATLGDLARVLDEAAAVPGKLAKQAILAGFFTAIDDDELHLGIRYASGLSFARTDERVSGVSGRIVSDVVRERLNISPEQYRETAIKHGELGDAIGELWGERDDAGTGLSFRELSEAFDKLAATTTPAIKRAIVVELFAKVATAREAAYLGKLLVGDFRTGAKEGVVQAAVGQAFGATTPQVQRAMLLTGDLERVAALAKAGKIDDATLTLFHPISFMLSVPIDDESFDSASPERIDPQLLTKNLWAEDKLDGIRAQIHKQGDRIEIYTRTLDRTDESFPDVVDLVKRIDGDVLLDGEIVVEKNGVVLPFAHVQKRLGRKKPPATMLRDSPATFIAFDCLYRDGRPLLDEPMSVRRAELESLAAKNPVLRTMPTTLITTGDDVAAAFNASRVRRNEGLILKDPASPYTPGRRGGAWLKLKTHLPTLDCVVVAGEYGHGKRRGLLSDYTFGVWTEPDDAGERSLLTIGKAYSGVTDAEILEMTERLKSISTANDGRVFLVPPAVVLEIAFDAIQPSERHNGGFALRFPRIKAIRRDRSPESADTIARVREIYESDSNLGKVEPPPAKAEEPTLFGY